MDTRIFLFTATWQGCIIPDGDTQSAHERAGKNSSGAFHVLPEQKINSLPDGQSEISDFPPKRANDEKSGRPHISYICAMVITLWWQKK
jgi:hypothetical protein